MARRLPNAELVVFEDSAHMMFAEEQDPFLATVRPVPRPHHELTPRWGPLGDHATCMRPNNQQVTMRAVTTAAYWPIGRP